MIEIVIHFVITAITFPNKALGKVAATIKKINGQNRVAISGIVNKSFSIIKITNLLTIGGSVNTACVGTVMLIFNW